MGRSRVASGSTGSWYQRDDHVLAAFANDGERAMSTVHVHRLDVGTERFADPCPQAVHRQQGDQRMIPGGAQPGLHEQTTELVSVQAERS